MELSPEERKLVQPYLDMKIREGKGWVVGFLVGLVVSGGAFVVWVADLWPKGGPYMLLVVLAGAVLIEQSLDHRDQVRMARILQKYHDVVKRYEQAEEYEESG
jgi:hypothetical protein